MEEKTEMLHKLCKAIMEELEDYSKRIEKTDGMSAGDLEAVDKLSHALKSIKTTVAMMEAGEEGEGYSGRYMPYWGGSFARGGNSNRNSYQGGNRGGNSNRGGSYEGGSYARRNNNPTGRNQYSRDGYSYAEEDMMEIIEEIRGMMDSLPEEKRRKVERLVAELER